MHLPFLSDGAQRGKVPAVLLHTRSLSSCVIFLFTLTVYASACDNAIRTELEPPYIFTYHKTGGLIGVDQRLEVNSASRQLSWRPSPNAPFQMAIASDLEIRQLTEKLRRARLPLLDDEYRCERCADHFHYTATLEWAGNRRVVEWETASDAPPALKDVGRTAEVLIARHFNSRRR